MITESDLTKAHSIATLGQECVTLANYLPKRHEVIGRECTEIIFKQLSQDETIPYDDRLFIAANIKQIIKHSQNQKSILEIADKYLSTTKISNTQSIDEDWFDLFLEECKTISNKDIQEFWGKILAEECQNPSSIKKKFLLTLKTLDKSTAEAFQKLNNLTAQIITPDGVIDNVTYLYINEIPTELLSLDDLLKMEECELIRISDFGYNSYSFKKYDCNYVYLKYFNTKIKVYLDDYNGHKHDRKLFVGNVSYTTNGEVLSKVIDSIEQKLYIDYLIKDLSKSYYIEY